MHNSDSSNEIDANIDLKEFSDATTFECWYLKDHVYNESIYIENLFHESEIVEIIKFGNLYVENQGKTGSGLNEDIRRCKVAWMFPNRYTEWIYQKVSKIINNINEVYFHYDLTKLENLQFTKYNSEENGFYDKHTDHMMGPYLPENRKLSFSIQLSDPSEYDGGELILHQGNKPKIFEKQKGGIIFFPSYTLHEVTPVTRGTRYSLVGWVRGPAFK